MLKAIEQQRATTEQRFTSQQNHQHDALQQRLLTLESKLAQAQKPLRINRWTIAEALYLVNIAEHHYRLGQNREMAIAALQQAHKQLAEHGSPELAPTLEQIIQITAKLKTAGGEHRQQQIIELGKLSDIIPELPIAPHSFEVVSNKNSDKGAPNISLQSVEGWRTFGSTLLADLQQLFKISRPSNSNKESQPITADIHPLIRQQLALKVEFTRLAMMGNSPVYTGAVGEIIELLNRFFDGDSELVKQQITLLNNMLQSGQQEAQSINFDAVRQQLTARGQ